MKKTLRLTALVAASLFLCCCERKAVTQVTSVSRESVFEIPSKEIRVAEGVVMGIEELSATQVREKIEQKMKAPEQTVSVVSTPTPAPTPIPEPVIIEEQPVAEAEAVEVVEEESGAIYSPSYFQNAGVIYWGNYRWTWYSERILPGYGLEIPGRYTNNEGYVCDGDGYVCLASNDLSKGTIVDTPFGYTGKVYDCGCASGTLDVYVGW